MNNHAAPSKSEREKWTEDLLLQASRGRELGRAHCGCEGHYHTLWGTLRACEAVGGLKAEEQNISPVVFPLIRDGSRLLIAGSADPGILCSLGRIVGSRNPRFTVIDKCPAPLAQIKEFAAMKGITCNTLHAEILELDGREEWDFIFVHYTHAFVKPSCHKDFFGALARSLAPGGTLACITKADRKSDALARQDFDSTWFTQARQAIRKSELRSYWESAELDEMLRAYVSAAATRRQNFLTLEDLVEGLEAAGLRVSVKNLITADRKKSEENVLSYASYASSPVILATRIAS